MTETMEDLFLGTMDMDAANHLFRRRAGEVARHNMDLNILALGQRPGQLFDVAGNPTDDLGRVLPR